MKIVLYLSFFVLSLNTIIAQDNQVAKYSSTNKGKVFFYWGWNRASYTNSDIRFSGDHYDFTLHDTKAKDNPTGVHIDYINPLRLTIPQTNFRLGYFFTDNLNISFGFDHMKYVMDYNQTVAISGYNNVSGYEINSDTQKLSPDYMEYEHTDGLNYVNIELARHDDITPAFITNTDVIQLNSIFGAGAGVLFPRTNAKIMDLERSDYFHVSGFGLAAKIGLNLTILKNFYIQSELKGGYINMPDIRTTNSNADKASQSFFFSQSNFVIGGIFKI